jgi:hypothetical protein
MSSRPLFEDSLRAQVEAWNRGDLEGYLARCAPDVVYVHAGGVVRGRDALRERYGAARGQLAVEIADVEVLDAQVTHTARWSVGDRGGVALLVWRWADGWYLAWDATIAAG